MQDTVLGIILLGSLLFFWRYTRK